MYTHGRARCLRERRWPVALAYAVFVSVLTLSSGFGISSAQDDLGTPTGDIGEVQVDQPVDESTEPSTEVEPPVDEPVIDEPVIDDPVVDDESDDEGNEQPSDTTEQPADAGTPDESAPPEELPDTPTPSPSPTPTATPPSPSLVIAQPTTLHCELAPAQPEAIASGGTQQYDCRAELGLTATAVDPSQVAIDWRFDAATVGAWTVQLRQNDQQPWTDAAESPVLAAQTRIDDVVPADDGGFSTVQTTTFHLLVTRGTCDLTPAEIQVETSASPSLDGASVNTSALPEPLKLQPELAPIGQPVVVFDGPLNFGSVSADASGPDISTLSGTLGLTLSGLNTTCGSWQVTIGGNGMVDETGRPLSGSQLLVLTRVESDVPCDVRDGCPVAQVAADPSADPTQSLSLDLELRLGDAVVTGTFSTSLTVTISPLDGPISDGNGE